MRVLYVDALSAKNALANVAGMTKAYRKVAQVRTFDYRENAHRYGVDSMNKSLIQVAGEFKPDFIHLGKCESVRGWAIERIKQNLPGVKVIHFFGDYRSNVIPWVVDIGRACDRTVMQIDRCPLVEAYERAINKDRKVGGKNIVSYWPAGTDSEIYGPRNTRAGRNMPVVFMGTLGSSSTFEWYGGRRELVEALIEHNHVHVYGRGWDKIKHARIFHHRYVGSDGFSQACSQAKIALGYSAKDVPGYTSWPRVLNSMICGTFFLTRYFVGLEKTFQRGVHLDWFESIPEAVEKVKFWLDRPGWRDKIARAGRKEVLRAHLWDHRIKRMLEYAGLK